MNCSVRWITIRYSPPYKRSVINPISIRFKANDLKGLFPRFDEQRYLYKVRCQYRLNFQRLAQMGESNIFHYKTKKYNIAMGLNSTPTKC